MAVLVSLAAADGNVVDKSTLLDTVWGTAVSEDVLTQAIVELRRVFGDRARDPHVIETIHRVGFRLLLDVRSVEKSTGTFSNRRIGMVVLAIFSTAILLGALFWNLGPDRRTAEHPSVAVLPFVNMSEESDNDFFSDGLSEEILHTVANLPGLRVTARTSSFAFKQQNRDVREIGGYLNVSAVLEGSVRRDGSKLRVTAQLIDVASGYHLWSDTYDREFEDLFAVQKQIGASVAKALQIVLVKPTVQLSPSGTTNTDAYASYLLGRHYMTTQLGDWAASAQDSFHRAIQIDPEFARAYAALAETYLLFHETPSSFSQATNTSFVSAIAAAEAAIERALELDPGLAEAYVAQASLAGTQHNLVEEEIQLRRAITLKPNYAAAQIQLGTNLLSQGQPEAALAAYRTAEALDPLNPVLTSELARLIAQLGDYPLAVSYPLKLIKHNLRSPRTYQTLIIIASEYGQFRSRLQWSLELVRLAPNRGAALAELADTYMDFGDFDLATYWVRQAAAISPLEAFKAHARILAASGHHKKALQLAEKALASSPLPANAALSPAQSGPASIGAVTNLLAGNYNRAVELFTLTMAESPTFARRPVYLKLYGRNLLAAAHLGLDETGLAQDILTGNIEIFDTAAGQGLGRHPPLRFELSKTYALLDRHEEAVQTLVEAMELGWRSCYLDGRRTVTEVNLFPASITDNDTYMDLLDTACEDIGRFRNEAATDGLMVRRGQL